MKKIIKCICIFALICINVYTYLFSYNEFITNNLILLFTLIFCILFGNESYKSYTSTLKYIIAYIFWNMNYLVFIKHINTLNSFIDTLLFKNVFIDILAILAIGNIILVIINNKKILNIIFTILFIILFIILKNNIFIYIVAFLIGNIIKLKDSINIKTNIFKIIDYSNIGILVFHYIILFLLIKGNIIHPNISDYIGTIVLIYIVGISTSYYLKLFPIIRNII